jgi:mannose-1-phosphate guanylyltransferase
VGINTHHLPEVMRSTAAAECARLGLELQVVHEPEIQGTGGGIRGLRSFLGDDEFVLFNGDILFALDVPALIAAHRKSGALATMALLPMPEHEKYAAVEVDSAFDVRKIGGQGPGGPRLSPWHFSGVHVMSPRVFEFMSERGPEDINRDVYLRAIARGERVHGQVVQGYWSDLGTPARYLATQLDVLFGRVPMAAFGEQSPFSRAARADGNWWSVGDGGAGAQKVAGPAFFDQGARVEPDAMIGSAVYVGPGASVPSRARLNRVCVLEGTRLRPDEEIVDAIAFEDHRIAAGAAAPK